MFFSLDLDLDSSFSTATNYSIFFVVCGRYYDFMTTAINIHIQVCDSGMSCWTSWSCDVNFFAKVPLLSFHGTTDPALSNFHLRLCGSRSVAVTRNASPKAISPLPSARRSSPDQPQHRPQRNHTYLWQAWGSHSHCTSLYMSTITTLNPLC